MPPADGSKNLFSVSTGAYSTEADFSTMLLEHV
jgi:hypothetical protein